MVSDLSDRSGGAREEGSFVAGTKEPCFFVKQANFILILANALKFLFLLLVGRGRKLGEIVL